MNHTRPVGHPLQFLAGGLVKWCAGLWLLAITLPALAVEPPVPAEFLGEWVPVAGSCQDGNRLRVQSTTVTLVNGPDSQTFGDLDICHSCEGGARYGGIVVWLLPEFSAGSAAPFVVRFNADEKKGVAIIDIKRDDLKRRFPIDGLKLRRCQP